MLRFLGSDNLVVVVDDEPAVARPGRDVLSKDLGENIDLRSRAGERSKVLAQAHLAVGHELWKRLAPTQVPAPLHPSTTGVR